MQDVEEAYDQLTSLIKASEDWSKQYAEDEDTFTRLLKAEAKMQRTFTVYLKELAARSDTFIYWPSYQRRLEQIKPLQASARVAAADDFQVDVLIQDGPLGNEDDIVLKLMFDQVVNVVTIGTDAAEVLYNRNIGTAELAKVVQRTARHQTATLVGKKIDKDGNIVTNTNPGQSITETTRSQIRESIRTSLSIGENQADAAARLATTLKNPKRAELVAQTESVNGYQGGMLNYAIATGATGKSCEYLGPARKKKADICGTNANAGIIGIKDKYPSGHLHPAFHPRCRCGERFHYPEE